MARKWIPACIGVLLVLIAIACVVGGCGKTVEGATGQSCITIGSKCDDKCIDTHKNRVQACGVCCIKKQKACKEGKPFNVETCIENYSPIQNTVERTRTLRDEMSPHP